MPRRKQFTRGQWITSLAAVTVVIVIIFLALNATDSRRLSTQVVLSPQITSSPIPANAGACYYRTFNNRGAITEWSGIGCRNTIKTDCLKSRHDASFYPSQTCPVSNQCGQVLYLKHSDVIGCVALSETEAKKVLLDKFKSEAIVKCWAANGSQCAGDVKFILGPTLLNFSRSNSPLPLKGVGSPLPLAGQDCTGEYEAWFICQP